MTGTRFTYRIYYNSSLVTLRNHKKICNILFRETATHHRDIRLPRRFRKGPKTREGGEYGFEMRTRRYQIRKRRKWGHLKPNVWTGETRDQAKTSTVRATAKGGRIYFRTHFKMTPERRAEIERVSEPEQRADVKTLKRRYGEMTRMKRFQRQRRKRLS